MSHNEFGGRAKCGYNAFTKTIASGCNDDRGHGSHTAGTVGGKKYGVAKEVTLFAVKVLNSKGEGSLSSVVGGVDFVTNEKKKRDDQPMVANMSVSARGRSRALDKAIASSSNAGVIFVVSAGNDERDACDVSPAGEPKAISVGATQSSDQRSGFSNFGRCVTIFAPGSRIFSAGVGDDDDASAKSGTSMASPHVTGAIALYLQSNPGWSTSQVITALQNDATRGAIKNVGNSSPNLLLNVAPVTKRASDNDADTDSDNDADTDGDNESDTDSDTDADNGDANETCSKTWLGSCQSDDECCGALTCKMFRGRTQDFTSICWSWWPF